MFCRYVLEHFDGLMCLIIFPWNKKVNSLPHFLIFCRPRISVTYFASPGCLWTPLVAVDQKANLAYPGFYNAGGLRRGGMARGPGGRKSPSGVQGQSPVRVLGKSPRS